MSKYTKLPDTHSSDAFVKYIPASEIKGLVGSLGHSISQEYAGEELVLVGLLKGSIIFMADLAREIKGVKVEIDFVHLKAIGRSETREGTIKLLKDIDSDIFNKHVLIVEEIIDTDRALNFVKKRLQQSNPKSLKVITLFDKPYKRKEEIVPDYIGKRIEDQFVIGHGLDLEEFGRNLEDIYFLKYPQ